MAKSNTLEKSLRVLKVQNYLSFSLFCRIKFSSQILGTYEENLANFQVLRVTLRIT